MSSKMRHEVKLKPFTVPNFVIVDASPLSRAEGMKEAPSFALGELSADALEALCDQFRRDVFAKASKRDPALDRPTQG